MEQRVGRFLPGTRDAADIAVAVVEDDDDDADTDHDVMDRQNERPFTAMAENDSAALAAASPAVVSPTDADDASGNSAHSFGRLIDWSLDFYDDDEDEALEDAFMMASSRTDIVDESTSDQYHHQNETVEFQVLHSIEEEEDESTGASGEDDQSVSSSITGGRRSIKQPATVAQQSQRSLSSKDGEGEDPGFNEEEYVVNRLGIEVDHMKGKLNSLFNIWQEYKKDEIDDFKKKRRSCDKTTEVLNGVRDDEQPERGRVEKGQQHQRESASAVGSTPAVSKATSLGKGSMILETSRGIDDDDNASSHNFIDFDELIIPSDVDGGRHGFEVRHREYPNVEYVDVDESVPSEYVDVDDSIPCEYVDIDESLPSSAGDVDDHPLDPYKAGCPNRCSDVHRISSSSPSPTSKEGENVPRRKNSFFQVVVEFVLRLSCSCQEYKIEDHAEVTRQRERVPASGVNNISPATSTPAPPPPGSSKEPLDQGGNGDGLILL